MLREVLLVETHLYIVMKVKCRCSAVQLLMIRLFKMNSVSFGRMSFSSRIASVESREMRLR